MMVCWIGCCEHRNLFKTHYNNNIIMIVSLVLFITGNKMREKKTSTHTSSIIEANREEGKKVKYERKIQTQRNTQKHINHQYKCIAQSINILLFRTNRSRSICQYGKICIYKVATYTTANVKNSIADLFSSYRLDGTESMVALPRLYSHDFQCSYNLIEVSRDNFGAHHIEVL